MLPKTASDFPLAATQRPQTPVESENSGVGRRYLWISSEISHLRPESSKDAFSSDPLEVKAHHCLKGPTYLFWEVLAVEK